VVKLDKSAKAEISKTYRDSLRSDLDRLSKAELIALVLDLSYNFEEVHNRLILKFVKGSDEIDFCRYVLENYIEQYNSEYGMSKEHIAGFSKCGEQILDKAQQKLAFRDYYSGAALSIIVLSASISMLSKNDDGALDYLIDTCIKLIGDCCRRSAEGIGSEDERRRIFHLICREASSGYYDFWFDWRAELLSNCVCLCKDKPLCDLYIRVINQLVDDLPKTHMSKLLVEKRLKLLACEALEKYAQEEELLSFLEKNAEYGVFRANLLQRLFLRRDYSRIVRLCASFEKNRISRSSPDNNSDWLIYLFRSCKALGDTAGEKKAAEDIVLGGNFSFYKELKSICRADEWEEEQTLLLEMLRTGDPVQPVYAEILLTENRLSDLLNYMKESGNFRIISYSLARKYKALTEDVMKSYLRFLTESDDDDQAGLFRDAFRQYAYVFNEQPAGEFLESLKAGLKPGSFWIKVLESV
jgi:hypothetical protein